MRPEKAISNRIMTGYMLIITSHSLCQMLLHVYTLIMINQAQRGKGEGEKLHQVEKLKIDKTAIPIQSVSQCSVCVLAMFL